MNDHSKTETPRNNATLCDELERAHSMISTTDRRKKVAHLFARTIIEKGGNFAPLEWWKRVFGRVPVGSADQGQRIEMRPLWEAMLNEFDSRYVEVRKAIEEHTGSESTTLSIFSNWDDRPKRSVREEGPDNACTTVVTTEVDIVDGKESWFLFRTDVEKAGCTESEGDFNTHSSSWSLYLADSFGV